VCILFSGGVDVEEEAGGGVDLFGCAFDVELVVGEVISYFTCLFVDPVDYLHTDRYCTATNYNLKAKYFPSSQHTHLKNNQAYVWTWD